MTSKMLTASDVAERLGVSRQAAHGYLTRGLITAQRTPGGQYRVAEADLEAFLHQGQAPLPPARAVTLAIVHHAGGVGKTTTTANLAYGLALAGQRVLVVDLDPQGDLSVRFGLTPAAPTLASALLLVSAPPPTMQRCEWDGLGFDVIPSSLDTMAGVELGLVAAVNGREQRLKRALAPLRTAGAYDLILLDCPPSLSLLTANALHAADSVIIPVQAHDKALHQVGQVEVTMNEVNEFRDPGSPVQLFGLVLTMVDKSAAMAGEVEAALRATYGDLVFETTIPLRTAAAADRRYQAPIGVYAPRNDAARAHAALAQEVIARVR